MENVLTFKISNLLDYIRIAFQTFRISIGLLFDSPGPILSYHALYNITFVANQTDGPNRVAAVCRLPKQLALRHRRGPNTFKLFQNFPGSIATVLPYFFRLWSRQFYSVLKSDSCEEILRSYSELRQLNLDTTPYLNTILYCLVYSILILT